MRRSSLALRGQSVWRRTTVSFRPLPAFVIIGAQRSGTTSLATWLWQHPSVQHPREAEIHFFDLHYEKGMRWYRAQFPLWRPRGATGETSPYMLYHPLAPARAARDLTDETRFIALLREPV
ncbi:MAG TPA: sulfotransferase, partial [Acidimicrobiales bacterium]|nr:sulfotransferase [Acidimicrobiales bacterium]